MRGQRADCPFCRRVRDGEFDQEAGGVVSFEPLNPVVPGHRLFLPEQHYPHGFAGIVAVGWAVEAAAFWGARLGVPFNLITSSGAAATQTVEHLHVHYVPRHDGDGLSLPWTGQA